MTEPSSSLSSLSSPASPRTNFYDSIMHEVEIPFVPGHTQTSLMALLQRVVHQKLCSLPVTAESPFLTTLHARFRSWAAGLEESQSLRQSSAALDVCRRLSQLTHASQLVDALHSMHQHGCHVLFHVQYDPDLREPSRNILYLRIGEPVLTSGQVARQREYIHTLFRLMQQSAPTTDVLHTEQQLFSRRPATHELQSTACFNPLSTATDLHGPLTWLKFYTLPHRVETVSLDSLAFFREVGESLDTCTVASWRDYLLFRWLHFLSPLYSDTCALSYQLTRDHVEPDWDHCRAEVASRAWWQDAGTQFIQHERAHLSRARAVVESLVADMKDSFQALLQHVDWHPSTRQEALQKLACMEILVGWPDSSSRMTPKPAPRLPAHVTFDEGVLQGHAYQYAHVWEQAETPADRARWRWESATVVNAFYSREANVVYLPAALFYPPFVFLHEEKKLATYCAMGCIVAHEMCHALDYDSRHLDADGRWRQWWQPTDEHRYMQAVEKTLKLYHTHQAGSSRSTLSENMADLMGLTLVWHTFLKRWAFSFDRLPSEAEAREFFRIYVVSQAQLYRPAAKEEARQSDLHAWAETRINVPLSTFAPFLQLFHIRRRDRMYTPVEQRPVLLPIRAGDT